MSSKKAALISNRNGARGQGLEIKNEMGGSREGECLSSHRSPENQGAGVSRASSLRALWGVEHTWLLPLQRDLAIWDYRYVII